MSYLALSYNTLTKARSRESNQVDTHDDGIVLNWSDKTFIHNEFEVDSAGKRTGKILKIRSGTFEEYASKKEADIAKKAINQYIKQLKETIG
jgi:hypothetical protein